MVDELVRAGKLPAEWRAEFEQVPRHLFVPDAVWTGDGPDLTPLVRGSDPDRWLDLVYSDDAITTQVDDGATPPGQPGRYATSSTSMPSIVAMMLDAARIAPGMRVLEIGTGTGWNAALLATRVGEGNVTTVEIDPSVADHARGALSDAGMAPTVVTADGADGYLPNAPYDRTVATCAVGRVPHPWVAQTPGGRIVTPWGTGYHGGTLLCLDVSRDGTACGRFGGDVAFMWLRDQRLPFGWLREHRDDNPAYDQRTTAIHPGEAVADFDAVFAIGLHQPGCRRSVIDTDDGGFEALIYDPASDSRAFVNVEPGGDTYRVRQHGRRKLWDEVEAGHAWWVDRDRPEHTRFGLTITPDEQWTWLDEPTQRVP
ncbi:MAG TPA: methyltransferase domain-containing protein [Mycobacteriales bacterium]|nr:methyltransferase domain-containing protein [Mycobacteriales bacterium]